MLDFQKPKSKNARVVFGFAIGMILVIILIFGSQLLAATDPVNPPTPPTDPEQDMTTTTEGTTPDVPTSGTAENPTADGVSFLSDALEPLIRGQTVWIQWSLLNYYSLYLDTTHLQDSNTHPGITRYIWETSEYSGSLPKTFVFTLYVIASDGQTLFQKRLYLTMYDSQAQYDAYQDQGILGFTIFSVIATIIILTYWRKVHAAK